MKIQVVLVLDTNVILPSHITDQLWNKKSAFRAEVEASSDNSGAIYGNYYLWNNMSIDDFLLLNRESASWDNRDFALVAIWNEGTPYQTTTQQGDPEVWGVGTVITFKLPFKF